MTSAKNQEFPQNNVVTRINKTHKPLAFKITKHSTNTYYTNYTCKSQRGDVLVQLLVRENNVEQIYTFWLKHSKREEFRRACY